MKAKSILYGVLTVILALTFAACSNGGGGGNKGGVPGDGTKKTKPEYFKPGTNEALEVGDTGPGGGLIFYDSFEDEKNAGKKDEDKYFTFYEHKDDTTGIQVRYLEAAPENIAAPIEWASKSFIPSNHATNPGTAQNWNSSLIGTTSKDVGTGMKNTEAILAKDSGAPAAKACRDAKYGGKTDWFLPSEGELFLLWENRALVKDLVTANYWSSSEEGNYGAVVYYLKNDTNSRGSNDKASTGTAVRAIRAF